MGRVEPLWVTHLKLFFVASSWGVAWTAGRWLALDLPPITGAWLRYFIAVPIFITWLFIAEGRGYPTRGEWKRIIVIGFFSTFLYQVFFMFGMGNTAAGDASLVITFNPLFTALLAIPFLGRPITRRLGGGLALGVAGIAVIFSQSPNVSIPADERMLGDALIAIAALSWACSTILMKRAMSEPAPDADSPMSPLALTVWASTVGLLLLTPWAGWESIENGIPTIGLWTWVSILFLAIVSTVISYVWFASGVEKIGAAQSALYVYLVPPFGILAGWILLDEQLGWALVLSFILIISGVILASSHPPGKLSETTQ